MSGRTDLRRHDAGEARPSGPKRGGRPLPPSSSAAGLYPQGRSEEHTSELQSLMRISYAVFCLKKKTTKRAQTTPHSGRKTSNNTASSNNTHVKAVTHRNKK